MVKCSGITYTCGFKNCYQCGNRYFALSKTCLRCPDCVVDRSDYMKNYYHKVTKVKNMDKKLKKSEKVIEKKIDKSEKSVEKEFRGLLKEDHKIDKRLETAERQLRKRK